MGLKPMLADTAEPENVAKYLSSEDWWTQLKADGQRYVIEVDNGELVVYNRAGVPKVSNISYGILAEFEKFTQGHWCFDGEYVQGDRLLLFDLPQAGELIGLSTPFEDRYQALELLYADWAPDAERVCLLPCARTTDDKLAMVHTAQAEKREGVMLRNRQGLYRPGVRSKQVLKFKFVKELDAIVRAVGVKDNWSADNFTVDGAKENALLCLLDPIRNKPVNIGVASTIGKKPAPQIGDVWTVRFLYVTDPDCPRLYQPRLMMVRNDKAMDECLFDQLADAWTDKDLDLKTREKM